MKITHSVVAGGHYITLHLTGRELTIRTENGTDDELQSLADDMAREAHAKLHRARLYTEAAASMRETAQAR
jgi:hypothetical protein